MGGITRKRKDFGNKLLGKKECARLKPERVSNKKVATYLVFLTLAGTNPKSGSKLVPYANQLEGLLYEHYP